MGIKVENLGKRFGDFVALDAIDLDIRQGELLALLGPSGSGKTTLLRVIAGLEHADHGRVLFGDVDASRLSVQERRVGFVFQHYALFKHMSVAENIAFGLKVRRGRERWPAAKIAARVDELLALVQLPELGARYPAQLSGGQRQRVALARALAIEPSVLLLDEPFGALDAQVRRDLRRWLRELHDRTGLTTIFVTHDQEEALELADRVAILNRGRIEQLSSPTEAYAQPASPFVYGFVGEANRLEGQVRGGQVQVAGTVLGATTTVDDGPVLVFVRPEDWLVSAEQQAGWSATVLSAQRTGARARIRARLEVTTATEVEVELPSVPGVATVLPAAGTRLWLAPQQYGVFTYAQAEQTPA